MSTSFNPSSVVPSPWISLAENACVTTCFVYLMPNKVQAENLYNIMKRRESQLDPQVLYSDVWHSWMVILRQGDGVPQHAG